MIVIKTNYTKKLNPIYVESVDASLLYINEISQEQELPIQCKMGKEWTDFEKIYTKEAVLNDSLFLRFMQKSIVRSGSDFCKDFIVVKFRYPAKYMIGEEEFSVSTHNLRKHYYENGVTFLSEKKTGKKKKQEDAESIHYKMLYRSPGKAKKGECIFIRENLFHKAINFLTMGLYDLMEEKAKADPEAVFKLVELSAYLSLSTATAIGYLHIPWEQILVVEDEKVLSIPKIAEVVRTHPVSYYDDEFVLDFDDSRLERILNKHDCTLFDDVANAKGYRLIQNRTKEEVRKNGIRINGKFPGKHIKKEKIFQECTVDRKEEQIENILWDGMGLIDESIFPEYADGFVYCRSHFFKSCLFRGNVQEYFKDFCVKNNFDFESYMVKDMFGNKKKLSDIKVVITDKSLKWLKFIDMMGGDNKKAYKIYRQYMKEHDDCFSVVKTAHKSKWGDLQLTAYQMNNSLPTTEEKILKPITEQAVRIIEELKKPDDITYLKYLDWKKDDFNINEVLCALVERNPDFRKTELFRTKKSKDINRLVDNFAEGRLPQQGDNLTICGNPIALLMKAVGENPLDENIFRIEDDAIQCYTERFEDNADLAAFRNPHNSPNNILHFHNIRADLIAKYFPKLGQNVIIINLIGTDAQARGSGFDEDSDFVLVTDQPELASLAKDAYVKYPTIINKVEELKSSEYHFRLEDYAEMDSKIADAQASIGTSTDAAQFALSYYYDDGMKSRELEEVFIILSVIGQISIDLAKKEFNLNVGREIKRIRNLPCMNKKFVPQFFADTKKRRNNKDFENVKRMNCPMDIMAEMIEQQTGYSERVSHVLIRELFNKKIKGKANKYKFNKLIEESKKYNDTVKILASSKRKGRLEDDELYKLKRRQMELFLRKASKNLDQITIIQLVNHALMDSNSDVMGTLLNFLYFNYREKFLNCFVENS